MKIYRYGSVWHLIENGKVYFYNSLDELFDTFFNDSSDDDYGVEDAYYEAVADLQRDFFRNNK
jgi:hypothetical protein